MPTQERGEQFRCRLFTTEIRSPLTPSTRPLSRVSLVEFSMKKCIERVLIDISPSG